MADIKPTNAVSSGVTIDPAALRSLMELRDGPGIRYLMIWAAMLGATGYALYLSAGSYWMAPALFAYATVMTVPAYAVSHEAAHGTFVKTKWLNTAINWVTALLYMETPVHRFGAHMRHHNYTWINGMDEQMPFKTPLNIRRWVAEISGIAAIIYDWKYLLLSAAGHHDSHVRAFTPEAGLPTIRRQARIFLAVYAALAAAAWWFSAFDILLIYLVVPRIVGGFPMQVFTIIQHAEMEEDQHDIRKSCRSFDTTWLGRFLYCHINYHIEHHLYPKVPFHALPALQRELGDQLPTPDKGLLATNFRVLGAILRRTFGQDRPAVAGNT